MPWKKADWFNALTWHADVMYIPKCGESSLFHRLGIRVREKIHIMVVPKDDHPLAKEFKELLNEKKLLRDKKLYPFLTYENKDAINETDVQDIQNFLAIINRFESFDGNEQAEIFQLIKTSSLTLEPIFPNLIFAAHDDIIFEILTKLLPLLKGLCTSYYADHLFSEKERGIYLTNNSGGEAPALNSTINSHNLAEREFLNSLEKYKISYRAIDDRRFRGVSFNAEDSNNPSVRSTLRKQDKYRCMADAYLRTLSPVLSVIGCAHVEGIQTEILNILYHSQAKSKFLFFYIYSNPENRYKNSYILPLDIIEIYASKETVEKVVEEIFKIVEHANKSVTASQQNDTELKVSNYPASFLNFKFEDHHAKHGTHQSASISRSPQRLEVDNHNDVESNATYSS